MMERKAKQAIAPKVRTTYVGRQKYIERLYSEWAKHGKIVIGVDFDDTISPWKNSSQEECNKVIKELILAVDTGAYIVIHTSCRKERYEEIKRYCEEKGLKVDSININPIELPYGNDVDSKPFCNIYLDDRAGLEEALEILIVTMYRMRGNNFKKSITEQNMF